MRRLVVVAVFFCSLLTARTDTILVLPLANPSDDSNLDWIGESISETIRETLSSEGVLVLDREDRQEAFRRLSIRPYAVLTRASVIQLAQSLDAAQVIYGEFRVTLEPNVTPPHGSLRISTAVLDVRRMKRGPQFEEVGPLEQLATLQGRIAWRALNYAAPKAAIAEEEFYRKRPAVAVEAIENYTRGLLAVTPEQKHKLFTQAARLDPRFSSPRFQLGRLHWAKKEYKQAAEWFEKVDPLYPRFREAKFFLGLSQYYLGQYAAAEQAFELVAKSVPLNEVYNNLGAAQMQRSAGTALDSFRKALEGDSNDPDYHFNVGYALWKLGDYKTAAEHFRAVLDRDPDDAEAIVMLGRSLKPAAGATKSSKPLERLKHEYEETAFRQLKAALEPAN
jgi:tetratricopeptide (TPR) repeat protein